MSEDDGGDKMSEDWEWDTECDIECIGRSLEEWELTPRTHPVNTKSTGLFSRLVSQAWKVPVTSQSSTHNVIRSLPGQPFHFNSWETKNQGSEFPPFHHEGSDPTNSGSGVRKIQVQVSVDLCTSSVSLESRMTSVGLQVLIYEGGIIFTGDCEGSRRKCM